MLWMVLYQISTSRPDYYYDDDDVIWRKQKIWKQTKQLVVT